MSVFHSLIVGCSIDFLICPLVFIVFRVQSYFIIKVGREPYAVVAVVRIVVVTARRWTARAIFVINAASASTAVGIVRLLSPFPAISS